MKLHSGIYSIQILTLFFKNGDIYFVFLTKLCDIRTVYLAYKQGASWDYTPTSILCMFQLCEDLFHRIHSLGTDDLNYSVEVS